MHKSRIQGGENTNNLLGNFIYVTNIFFFYFQNAALDPASAIIIRDFALRTLDVRCVHNIFASPLFHNPAPGGGGGMSYWGLYIIRVNHFLKST